MVIHTSANTSIVNNTRKPRAYIITTLLSKYFVKYLKHFVHDIQVNYHKLADKHCKTHYNMNTNQEQYTIITNSNTILLNDDSDYHN